ncbi:MAG: glycosyltransferase family 4 protein [Arcobacter sp.]|uniref:glycosyltransferase family 4 protein n=1 Tax=Arcobacter sp. TaxID=1872629 RepID=UPI003AFF6FEB
MEYVLFRNMEEKSMRVAFLSHIDINLYLFRLPIMIELVNKGYEVFAICPKGEKFYEFKKYGITAISYKISRKSLNPFKELKTIRNIYKTIKPLNLDILHSFTAKPNIYGSIAGHFAKVPKILNTVTGMGSFYIQNTKKAKTIRTVIEKLYKEANKKVNGVIFQNSDDMNYFIEKKLVSKKNAILIKSSGIDSLKYDIERVSKERVDDLKNKLDIGDSLVVLMVARAIWDKGIKEYYESANYLSQKYPNVKFLYVGDTDEGNLSCANKEFLISSNVIWLGHRNDILELTALCDIYVLPSYREGVPRTLLEAASMSKAIITTNAIGCREVVNNNFNGILVKVKDSNSLSLGIEKLILDEDLRHKMGKNGRIKVLNEFDVKIVVKEYMEVYEKNI